MQPAWVTPVAAAVFAAAIIAIALGDFDPTWVLVGVALVLPLAVGFAIGRWWSLALALVWLVSAVIAPSEDSGVLGTLYLVAIITVPVTVIAIALGVVARRLITARSRPSFARPRRSA